jgi:uncharacterized cupredoxin-like copper-binding protein
MRHITIRPIIALLAVGSIALGVVQLASASIPQRAHAAAATTQVKGREFRFTLSSKSVAKPGTVTFNFTNTGTVAHDFKIDGKTTPLLQPGHTAKLVVRFKRTGKFSYLCTVPGHAAAGMRGVFTVR